MNALVSTSTFTNLEEIGPRLRTFRESAKIPVSRMSEKSGLSSCVIVSAEKGMATTRSLQAYADALGLTLDIRATDANGITKNLTLDDLQSYVRQTRESLRMTKNNLGRICGVQGGSVNVFESSARTNIKSAARYIEGLGTTLEIGFNVDGKDVELPLPRTARKLTTRKESNNLTTAVGEAIKAQRMKTGISKLDLARRVGIAHATIYKIEQGLSTSLPTFNATAQALGYNVVVTLSDGKGTVLESPAHHVTSVLNSLREASGISIAEMARRMDTTYRTVKIFADGSRNPIPSIERYATALGITLGVRLEKMNK